MAMAFPFLPQYVSFTFSSDRLWVAKQQRVKVLCFSAPDREIPYEPDAKKASFHGSDAEKNRAGAKCGVFRPVRNFLTSIGSQNNELKMQLKRYGIAGILAYGLFNTCYYLATFLFVWFRVTPSPGRLGYAAAAQRFMKVLAAVWAGSQVTKLLRAAGALALAPVVDTFLSWFTQRFGFQSREKAFGSLVAACFGLALVVFLVIVSLSA